MSPSTLLGTGAGAALIAAARDALAEVAGLNGAYDGPPLAASLPYATFEAGAESDWSWKGGVGRELRLAAAIRDAGEKPERLRALMARRKRRWRKLRGRSAAGGW